MTAPRFPLVIRKGSVQVKLYHGQNKLGYHSYYVVYYLNRKRKRVAFSDPKKAIAAAKEVADRLDKQEGVVVEIHPKDRLSYQSARRYLEPRHDRRERMASANAACPVDAALWLNKIGQMSVERKSCCRSRRASVVGLLAPA